MMKGNNPRYTYKPGAYDDKKYQLSRTGIEEFLDCKKCFYLHRRLGLKKLSQIPFNLNNAVDNLFKNEFDYHRRMKTKHPIMEKYEIDAIPYKLRFFKVLILDLVIPPRHTTFFFVFFIKLKNLYIPK